MEHFFLAGEALNAIAGTFGLDQGVLDRTTICLIVDGESVRVGVAVHDGLTPYNPQTGHEAARAKALA